MEVPRDGYQQLFIYLYWLEDMGCRSNSYVASIPSTFSLTLDSSFASSEQSKDSSSQFKANTQQEAHRWHRTLYCRSIGGSHSGIGAVLGECGLSSWPIFPLAFPA